VTADDLRRLLSGVLGTHPGLEFLRDAPEFQDRCAPVWKVWRVVCGGRAGQGGGPLGAVSSRIGAARSGHRRGRAGTGPAACYTLSTSLPSCPHYALCLSPPPAGTRRRWCTACCTRSTAAAAGALRCATSGGARRPLHRPPGSRARPARCRRTARTPLPHGREHKCAS
jgi:hypothetical protein